MSHYLVDDAMLNPESNMPKRHTSMWIKVPNFPKMNISTPKPVSKMSSFETPNHHKIHILPPAKLRILKKDCNFKNTQICLIKTGHILCKSITVVLIHVCIVQHCFDFSIACSPLRSSYLSCSITFPWAVAG